PSLAELAETGLWVLEPAQHERLDKARSGYLALASNEVMVMRCTLGVDGYYPAERDRHLCYTGHWGSSWNIEDGWQPSVFQHASLLSSPRTKLMPMGRTRGSPSPSSNLPCVTWRARS